MRFALQDRVARMRNFNALAAVGATLVVAQGTHKEVPLQRTFNGRLQ